MRWHWYYLPGYVWALLNTLSGLLLVIIYRPTSWRFSDGCIEAIGGDRIFGKPGAQTWGYLIYYRDEAARARKPLRVHERVHVVHGFILGPLFLPAYGLHFVWLWLKLSRGSDWKTPYRQVWSEKLAYRIDDEYGHGDRPNAWGGD